MQDLKLIGILAKEGNEYIFIPVVNKLGEVDEKGETGPAEVGESGVVVPPTPKEVKISKEQVKDYSADGILKKYTVSKEGVQE